MRAVTSICDDRVKVSFWGKLRQIIQTQSFFEARHLVYHLEKTVFSKQLVFLLLEVLAERRVFVFGNDGAESGKQDRVLTRLMRPVHVQEGTQSVGQSIPVSRDILQGSSTPEFANFRGEFPSSFVLNLQRLDQRH